MMTRVLQTLVALLGLLLSAPAFALVLAVGSFEPAGGGEAFAPLRKALADMFITDLYGTEGLEVVERDRLQAVMAEIKLGKQGFLDPATVQKLGKGVGASHLLHGSFAVVGGQLRMDARLVEVATGKVQLAAQHSGPQDDVFAIQRALADQLRKALALGAAPTPKSGKVSLGDATKLGEALDAIDAGKLDEARKLLESLQASRPDFAAVQRGLEALSRKIAQLMEEAKFLPEQMLATLEQIGTGNTAACQDFMMGLGEWMTPLSVGVGQQVSGQLPADDPDAQRRLAGAYALVLAALQNKHLTDTSCPGGSPAAYLLGYFLAAPLQMLAAEVKKCDALGQSLQRGDRASQFAERCTQAMERLPDLRAPGGALIVAKQDYVQLYVQLGQKMVERFPKHVMTRTMLPRLQEFVEHAKVSALTGKARDKAVAELLVKQARQAVQTYGAQRALQVGLVQWPSADKPPSGKHWAEVSGRMQLFDNSIVAMVLGGAGKIEFSADGASWHTWPLRTELPGQEEVDRTPVWRKGLPASGVFGVQRTGSDPAPDWPWHDQVLLRALAVDPAVVTLRLIGLDGAPLAVCSAKVNESTRNGPVLTAVWLCSKPR